MKTKRIISLLLLAAMLAAVGCGDAKPSGETTTSSNDTTADTEPVETKVTDDLPADLVFTGRELRVLTTENTTYAPLYVEEANGDILNDAIYNRNERIMDRFGITINEQLFMWSDARDNARRVITAGEDAYDLISLIDREALTFASEGMLWSAEDTENIDLSKPYWNKFLNSCITLGDRQILAYSDMCITTYDFTHIMLFNKQMIENLKLTSPYDLVEDGSWTIDKFGEYAALAANDLNGDGTYDKNDRFGFVSLAKQIAPCFWIGAGCVSMEKNDEDIPEFTMGSERMLTVIQKAYDLTWGDSFWFIQKEGNYEDHTQLFTKDQALFSDSCLGDLFKADYREMKSDYGIIPYPKYDEAQDKYYSRVEGGCPYFIPVTVTDTAFAGAIMEAMACESYNSVVPTYYEIALKAKYTRDSQSGAILDMMMENRVYDWGDTFFTNFVRDGFVFRAFNNGNTVAASDIESNRTAVEGAIKNVADAIADLK